MYITSCPLNQPHVIDDGFAPLVTKVSTAGSLHKVREVRVRSALASLSPSEPGGVSHLTHVLILGGSNVETLLLQRSSPLLII